MTTKAINTSNGNIVIVDADAPICATITNKWLDDRGLTSLSNLYAKVHLFIPAAI